MEWPPFVFKFQCSLLLWYAGKISMSKKHQLAPGYWNFFELQCTINNNCITNKILPYKHYAASSLLGVTKWSTLLWLTFLLMLSTAWTDMSLETISFTPGISIAYRIERRPDAAKASRIRISSSYKKNKFNLLLLKKI